MKYRRSGMMDCNLSALGFSVMQLPSTDENSANTNEAGYIKMIRYAIDHGVNYLDSGWPYTLSQLMLVVVLNQKR